jgi:hypothetical protein
LLEEHGLTPPFSYQRRLVCAREDLESHIPHTARQVEPALGGLSRPGASPGIPGRRLVVTSGGRSQNSDQVDLAYFDLRVTVSDSEIRMECSPRGENYAEAVKTALPQVGARTLSWFLTCNVTPGAVAVIRPAWTRGSAR